MAKELDFSEVATYELPTQTPHQEQNSPSKDGFTVSAKQESQDIVVIECEDDRSVVTPMRQSRLSFKLSNSQIKYNFPQGLDKVTELHRSNLIKSYSQLKEIKDNITAHKSIVQRLKYAQKQRMAPQ